MAVECVIPDDAELEEDEQQNPLLRYALILPFFFWGSSMVAMKVRGGGVDVALKKVAAGHLDPAVCDAPAPVSMPQHFSPRTAN
jgi:hypothetical protein